MITKNWLEHHNACKDGKKWAVCVIGDGMELSELLPKFERADWMLWTLRRASKLTKVQYVELAVICAQRVLAIYDKKYPKDDRPRKAIEAAMAYAKDPSEKNRKASAAAAYAAYAAAYAAYADAADAAYAAYAAYAAAYAAADAAYAAAAAAYAAYAAAYAGYRKSHHKKMCALLLAKLCEWGVA